MNAENICKNVDSEDLCFPNEAVTGQYDRVDIGDILTHIKESESDHQADVAPSMGVVDAEAGFQELIGGASAAVVAGISGLGVGKVSSSR